MSRVSPGVPQGEALHALLTRLDEVRGLSGPTGSDQPLDPRDPDALIAVLAELVESLEKSHRRLIETNVQLVSLREVASRTLGTHDPSETARTVTRYLARAFGFDHVFLLLADTAQARLEGAWTSQDEAGRETTTGLEVPLVFESGMSGRDVGGAARTFWLNRPVVHHAGRAHPPAVLPEGHALHEVMASLGVTVCVPLPRGEAVVPASDTHELCGARCVLGDVSLLAPPPGTAAGRWGAAREHGQRHCLRCELLPILGVIGAARRVGHPASAEADVALLESIALSVATVVETARLTQALRRSERFREHVLDSMASALVAIDLDTGTLTFNRAAETLLGWRAHDVLGEPVARLLGGDAEALLRRTLEHGHEVLREEVLVHTRDGAALPTSFTTSLLRNERRAVYGAIATFVDLTPLKRAEEHARRLDRLAALGRFTSSVAHEIRNPLTGIAAGIQYLARSAPTAGAERENLDFILREVQRLDHIVQDLFDITHPRGLQLRTVPLEDIVRRAAQCLEALYAERDVTLAIDVATHMPPVPHDPDQLEQVVINLLKNAAEASPRGGAVQVAIAPAPDGARVSVTDAGPGIDPERQKTVFEPFVTTKQNGSGLGLYISHDIVKRHGGRLALKSEPGEGATFVVELPLETQGGTT